MIMGNIYLMNSNLVAGPPPLVRRPFRALITGNSYDEAIVLAIDFLKGNEILFKHINSGIRGNKLSKIRKKEVPLQDLPLYIGWPWKTPEFMALLKAGCND